MDQFFPWLWKILDLPAMLLVAVMAMMFYVLYRIQANPNNGFDFADMFRDENGKPSAARIMVLVCGGVSSWVIMYMIMHSDESKIDPIFYGLYVGAWSGTALASKWMDLSKMNASANINLRADYSAEVSERSTSRRDHVDEYREDSKGGSQERHEDKRSDETRVDKTESVDARVDSRDKQDPRDAERRAAERRAAEREAAQSASRDRK